ncbi:hypothetical protein [Psychroserpens burtonensis]|nr:hypothetical protein [Psychroserpens burtonensis]
MSKRKGVQRQLINSILMSSGIGTHDNHGLNISPRSKKAIP